MFPVIKGSFDSHLHLLSMEGKSLHVEPLMRDLFQSGLAGAIDVGIDGKNWERRKAFALEFPKIYLSEGIHPSEASHFELNELTSLRQHFDFKKTIAVGEIGLDWYRGRDNHDKQVALFRAQMALAFDLNLPVIIHNRDAEMEILPILKEFMLPKAGVFHCFSSNLSFAEEIIALGYLISFSGNVTYPQALSIKETAANIPLNKILVETDAPFLSPQPERGKLNHPGHIHHTISFLAQLRNMSGERMAQWTRENAKLLFNFPE